MAWLLVLAFVLRGSLFIRNTYLYLYRKLRPDRIVAGTKEKHPPHLWRWCYGCSFIFKLNSVQACCLEVSEKHSGYHNKRPGTRDRGIDVASSCLMAASNSREEDDDDDVDDELRSEWHKHHEMAKAPSLSRTIR